MEASDQAEPKPVKKVQKSGGLAETTRFLLFLFLFAIILRSFIVAPFMIPSGSMLPRMMIGDYLFVAKWPYGFSRYSIPFGLASFDGRILANEPERGDIVIFQYPGRRDEDYVKRLIGLPGDTVQVRGGQIVLNGEAVPRVRIADYLMPLTANSPCRYVEPEAERPAVMADGRTYCAYRRYRETLPSGRSYQVLDQYSGSGDDTPVFVVPEGHYFMMGDNRDDSLDSRFSQDAGGVGFLPADHLVGRALITFFSTDGSAAWLKPWTWLTAARWDRIGETY
ncbi:signal peptidase I [Sphingosinicella rhizophila]|uniref:Signal peptidase I n=1 Tax=Sphingosinicella rhizophila TaxID=3050082 RepID=A0ABU3QBM0_9SPHN|nr:signal peptidase I [Sphingosinicella sp. GR2756]MDT9600781.1 signal peptidase I [Sphingosinicella sp. GR2756]